MLKRRFLSIIACCSLFAVLFLGGCDFIYGILQREGAQEKKIIGDIPPFTYNPKVEEIQQILEDFGYSSGKVDGKFGPNTRKAVEKFQKEQGLKVTRFVDQATWKKLQALKNTGLIERGAINMKAVQRALDHAGYSPGAFDGKPGPMTQEALVLFQKEHGLKPDGVIGMKTINKLLPYLLEE